MNDPVSITVIEVGSDHGTPTRRATLRYFRFPPNVGDIIAAPMNHGTDLQVIARRWNPVGELEIVVRPWDDQ